MLRRAANLQDVSAQRRSFAFGNGNIGQDRFSRATMSMVVPARFDSDDAATDAAISATPAAHPHNVEGALRQADLAMGLIRRFTEPDAPAFKLVPEIIVDLHDALRDFASPNERGFRAVDVHIADSKFGPVKPEHIVSEVAALCDEVNSAWEEWDAVELASYVLWRLNWIHPFVDGNGRTARALSYVVLNIKLGFSLPGAPTIPEQILHQRGDYLDALADADTSVAAGKLDLSSLRALLDNMLVRQLTALPALSSGDIDELECAIARRLSSVRRGGFTSVFGHGEVVHRLWSLDDHMVLQLGPQAAIAEAEQRHLANSQPFPRLFSTSEGLAGRTIPSDERGVIIRDRPLNADKGYALLFEPNAAATIEHPNVQWRENGEWDGWSAIGALYVLRFGPELMSEWAGETLDLLIARHIADLNP